ncbi:hypothetical protein [Desulfosporosinus sp. Sb-LF]|uniref:hypothetical protein n=1 Tax=Desulfosporosinus sp. Sb-LF TaxID=2560027 RepID=UPI0013051D98|nr:hypothetical protein [Desulfosporosinus sp. Sb-LF]
MVAVFMVMAVVAVAKHKLTFVDSLVIVMVIALSLASDMLLCKQFSMYYIVSVPFKGWYSFWSGILVFPSLAITFIKFAPKSKYAVALYVAVWTFALTLFEILIVVPYRISVYPKWKIIPWSPIVYLIAFTLIYVYHKILEKRCI